MTPEAGGSLIRQTALFDPVGLRGLLYWYALWGIHRLVFAGMLRNIARAAAVGGDPTTTSRRSPVRRDPTAMIDGIAPGIAYTRRARPWWRRSEILVGEPVVLRMVK